jgi:hypothetical protein
MSPNLPYKTTFEALAQLLACHGELGFKGWSLRVRTVAFKHQDSWFHFATSAWMEDGARELDKKTVLRQTVAIIDYRSPVSEPLTPHDLTKALTYWRTALGVGFGLTFQGHTQLNRSASDSRRGEWPGWWTQLHAQDSQTSHPLPDGPFFDLRNRLFSQDVPRLAMQFLGESKYVNSHNPPNEYVLRIPDRRARIRSLSLEENALKLTVDNPAKLSLFWSVVATPFSGSVFSKVVDVIDDTASLSLPFAVQNLETWVILEDGYMLDSYQENPHYSTWGADASLFNAPRRTESKLLLAALGAGENDAVEFKRYTKITPPRDKKSFEILRAVSAFANTAGGDLYIGVNDEGEPVGIESELYRDYGGRHEDGASRQAAFEKDLRKLVNEGTAPNLNVDFHWHDVAHRAILQVHVPQSVNRVCLLENGEIYRRAGATSRKWRPIEAVSIESKKRGPFDL